MGPKKHPQQTPEDQARMGVDCRYMTRAERKRVNQSRYRRSEKGKAAQARYRSTALGHQINAESNARRIFVRSDYRGRAQTAEQAAAIQRHAKERIREFISRQSAGA